MYRGSTVESGPPARASEDDFRRFGRLPAWHLEEAASLVAGYVPRPEIRLNFRPIAGLPSSEVAPNPDDWAFLLDSMGAVGSIIAAYNRALAIAPPEQSRTHVQPIDFLRFCSKSQIDTPPGLRFAVANTRNLPNVENARSDVERRRDALRSCVKLLVGQMPADAPRLTRVQLLGLFQCQPGNEDYFELSTSTFDDDIAAIKDSAPELVSLLRTDRGRQPAVERERLREILPEYLAVFAEAPDANPR